MAYDFFLSYSTKDEETAKFVDGVLQGAGYTVFSQFRDMPAGSNFVREMNNGLASSARVIALLSNHYTASDYCQAEWSAAYASDPGGRKRKLIPILITQTDLEPLAQQIVHRSIVGLSYAQAAKTILDAVAPSSLPTPVANVPSPFTYAWTNAGKLSVAAGPQNFPIFPFPTSEKDHAQWLDACRKLTQRLLADLRAHKFNVRAEYGEALSRYQDDLPPKPGEGNFILADAEARILRDMFAADAECLSPPFASRLKTLVQQHIALRGFYPEVETFYDAVRRGQLEQPLPQDAVEGFASTVRERTPDVFEPAVSSGLHEVEREPPTIELPREDLRAYAPNTILPPPDPLGALEPQKSRSFGIASSINSLYEVFLKGKDLPRAVEGWSELAHKLGEHAGPITEWLKNFLPPT